MAAGGGDSCSCSSGIAAARGRSRSGGVRACARRCGAHSAEVSGPWEALREEAERRQWEEAGAELKYRAAVSEYSGSFGCLNECEHGFCH